MAKFDNKVNVHDDAPVANYISQIKVADGTTYDIATHHSIKFVEGGEETTWNGLSDLTVVIPTITDIVQSPIEFAGTVGANGTISWNDGHKDGPKTGYLVFFTSDCPEFVADSEGAVKLACEAGDMAIYDGSKWNVVSGENQVQLVGTTDTNNRLSVAVGSSKDVLTVEGKTLALSIDYDDIEKNITKVGGEKLVPVSFTAGAVGETFVKLSQGTGTNVAVGEDTDLNLATSLANGNVTFNNNTLIGSVNFGTFTPGTLPSFTPNSAKDLTVSGGVLSKNTKEDFVESVSLGKVRFVKSDGKDENKINVISSVTGADGSKAFLSDIHLTGVDETADLVISGVMAPERDDVKFVEGIAGGLDPVTSISDGDFKLVSGSDLATGFTTAVDGKGGEVLSDVTVTTSDTSVLSSATVVSHILTFGAGSATNSVSLSYKSKSLTKKGFEYTKPVATKTSFVKSGFTKTSNVSYTFAKSNETALSANPETWTLDTPQIIVSKAGYDIQHNSMKAAVPAGYFIASATEGTLPNWTGGIATPVELTGTVSTELTTTKETIRTVSSTGDTISIPGAYTLSAADAEGENTVKVGKYGNLANIGATVNLEGYLTDVTFVKKQ